MVNHVRTLLLNRGRDGTPPDFPGEEYVVPNYRERRLSLPLLAIHRLLFGTDPDRLFLNYRLRQFMGIVHASETASLVSEKDVRLTYDVTADTSLFDTVFTSRVTRLYAAGPLYLTGSHSCDEGSGRCSLAWRLTVLDETSLRLERRTPPLAAATVAYTMDNGLSSPVALPGSKLSVRFATSPTDASWLIESNARPLTDPGILFTRLETATGERLPDILFPATGDSIDQSLRNVWSNHPVTAQRFAAVLLGLARRIDELPQQGVTG